VVVLLASLVNDWCVAYSVADPLNQALAYRRHGQTIWLVSILLFAVGLGVIWIGRGGWGILGGAVIWFFFLSSWVNFPLLTRLGVIPQFPA